MSIEDETRETLSRIAEGLPGGSDPNGPIRMRIARRERRSRIGSALAAVVIASVSFLALVAAFRAPSQQRAATLGSSEGGIHAKVVDTYQVAGAPSALTAGDGAAEVVSVIDANCSSAESTVTEVLGDQTRLVGTLDLVATAVASSGDEIWVGGYSCAADGSAFTATVISVDAVDGSVMWQEKLGAGTIWDLAVSPTAVWVAHDPTDVSGQSEVVSLSRVDSEDQRFAAFPSSVRHLGVDANGDVWGSMLPRPGAANDHALFKLDQESLDVVWVVPSSGAELSGAVVFGSESAWVAGIIPSGGDAEGSTVAVQISLGPDPQQLTATEVPSAVLQPVGVDRNEDLWFVGGEVDARLQQVSTDPRNDPLHELKIAEHHDLLTAFDREAQLAWIVDVKTGTVSKISVS